MTLQVKFEYRSIFSPSLRAIYAAIKKVRGASDVIALVVSDDEEYAAHESAQRDAGASVAIYGRLREADVVEGEGGRPVLRRWAEAVAEQKVDGWIVSDSLISNSKTQPALRTLLGVDAGLASPLLVGPVDDEHALRRAWAFQPDGLVSRRPRWARRRLREWEELEWRAWRRGGCAAKLARRSARPGAQSL